MASLKDFVNASPDANDFRVPELPDLAALVKSNGFNNGLQRFNELMREWRTNLERSILERLKIVSTPALAATPATATLLTARITAQNAAAIASMPPAILGLAAHIAATKAHGTASSIVGQSDEQSLDRKTIGLTDPRQAKFTQITTQNTIAFGSTVTIGAGENMVMTGPLNVLGTFTVLGYFLVL